MAETPKAPELTKPVDFIVPNQDLFEQVIDSRLAAHSAHEESSSKTKTTRNAASTKDDSKDAPKS